MEPGPASVLLKSPGSHGDSLALSAQNPGTQRRWKDVSWIPKAFSFCGCW